MNKGELRKRRLYEIIEASRDHDKASSAYDFMILTAVLVGMFRMLRLLRIFQLLRVLKLFRYSKTLVTIVRVAKKVKSQLLAVLILTFMYIITSALLIFQIEPNLFNSFFDAMYWATISITTIGYGDISPLTSVGRFITMISALVGVAIIALPSGIITAAYMDEINKHKSI